MIPASSEGRLQLAGSASQRAEPAVPPPLSVHGLRKTFQHRTVLEGIHLDVPAGQFVAMLGANGSGKSTVLRCVVGLELPDAGSVHLGGRDVLALRGEDLRRCRRSAAMIFQQIHLVKRRTALDNVCSGALGRLPLHRSLAPMVFPAELRSEAMDCLDQVGLVDRAAERVSRLSGGQQQRVAIARALCQRADVVLADEPVAALDPTAADQVLALLADLSHTRRLAVVAVLHQPELARRYADRIVGLSDGRVRLDTSPSVLTTGDLARLYPPRPTASVSTLATSQVAHP
jgi:phosphonate transport system ATP-binding protein